MDASQIVVAIGAAGVILCGVFAFAQRGKTEQHIIRNTEVVLFWMMFAIVVIAAGVIMR